MSKDQKAGTAVTLTADVAKLFRAAVGFFSSCDNDAVKALSMLDRVEALVTTAGGFPEAKEAITSIAEE